MSDALREAVARTLARCAADDEAFDGPVEMPGEVDMQWWSAEPRREAYYRIADAVLAVTETGKAEAATLKAFVRDLATHGIRFDLNPTLDSRDPLATDRYVGRIDMDIRKRAIQALGLAAEAGITVDPHTEES